MSSDELETALRNCFSRQVARSLGSADRAGVAVARARRMRRRRAAAGVVATFLVTAVVVTGLVRLTVGLHTPPSGPAFVGQEPADAETSQPAATYDLVPDAAALSKAVQQEPMTRQMSLPIDVVVADHLRTREGESISLTMVGAVAAAYRVTSGWLVVGSKRTGRTSLWHVAKGGRPVELLSAVERLVVSVDGRRVAWRYADHLFIGTLTKGQLTRGSNTAAPADGRPIGFVGTGVLLASDVRRRYDVWWPDRGSYEPTWRDLPSGVYGSLRDGRTVVAQVAGPSAAEPCLALLDATAGLQEVRRTCNIPLTAGAIGWVSPDGRWLVARGAQDTSVLVDLSTAFGDRPPAVDAGPGPYGAAVWLDANTVVHAGPGGELVRLHLTRLANRERGGVEWISVDIVEAAVTDRRLLVVPQLAT